MQILISIIINVIILAVVMPLFYVYIVSRARERLEKEVIKKARDEIEALVKEFNNIALSRISLLEDAITRANNLNKQLNEKDPQFSQLKEKKEAALNANIKMKYDVSALDEKNILDIKVEDDKKDITEKNEEKIKESLNNNNNILDITIEKTEKIEKENKQIEENNVKETIKEDNNSKKEEIKISRYDEIRKIKENSKKEAIEKLRKQLDMTIRNNITLNRNNNSEDNSSANDYNSDEKIKHENILKLHKEGLSNKEIAAKLKCSLTEVDIIIELNNN
ncbi:hypothetical protein [Brachyspira pilosicoli]|uniref:hypothetical protein n=1 Tax=Brachyspira pilosicoli TaxID=52584 RepID=UPI0025439B1D|nr:hypothetical protein [Brachyspira pilosicoli]WIH81939.1 hypothetical protein NEI04_02915 [Brachyspira pilosicoli]